MPEALPDVSLGTLLSPTILLLIVVATCCVITCLVVGLVFLRLAALLHETQREVAGLNTTITELRGRMLDSLLALVAPGALRILQTSPAKPISSPVTLEQDAVARAATKAKQEAYASEIASLMADAHDPGIYPQKRGTPPRPPSPPTEQ